MATAFTPGLQVKAQTTIRKVRELPTAGDVLVKVGESVRGHQEIARARQPGELRILKVAEALGIEPIEVMAGLKTEVGKTISEGTIVCEHTGLFGLFRSSYKSPVAGVVEFITERTGHIGVRLPEIGIALDAYIDGVVTDIKGSKSITIESNAAFIQGIFGVGGERRGKITNLKVPPTKILTPAEIPASAKDAILVGGTRPQLAALRRAADAGAAGLVVGSIDDEALAGFLGYDLGIALTGDEEIPFTIIVTEGFGELAISPRIVDLLQSLEGETASINGATQVRAGAVRPEIIVSRTSAPLQQTTQSSSGSGLQVGSRVRIIRVPYFGLEAEVAELPKESVIIETGAHTRVLRAKLENGEIIVVPRANVELL